MIEKIELTIEMQRETGKPDVCRWSAHIHEKDGTICTLMGYICHPEQDAQDFAFTAPFEAAHMAAMALQSFCLNRFYAQNH